MLDIKKTIEGEKALLELSGRIDSNTAVELEQAIKESIDGVTELTLDMKETEYISSAGLRVLLAAQKQMNELEEKGLVVEGTRNDIVNNQVCVVTYDGSKTSVTGLENLADASSLALADGSVPVGKYTREALVAAGMMEAPGDGDVSAITTQEISEALGGIEINECANVGAVAAAVVEGANEVGTVYYSDTYGFEDQLIILEKIPYDLTGDVLYPAAQIVNQEADEAQSAAAADFAAFLASDEAKEIFDSYYFDTNIGAKAQTEA